MGCNCSKQPPGGPTLLTERRTVDGRREKLLEVSCHASEGSKWHLELEKVNRELKSKLQDPRFVATRCDLDGSGDLDLHELKQASRVYGIAGAQELMDGQRISKESFAAMVASRVPGLKPIRAIPHSLRGIALGQLQHLQALFVDSGWLSSQCASFNRMNTEAILNGTRFKQWPNLYALDTFVVTPITRPGPCEAREHAQGTIAEATHMKSFSELVNPNGLIVHCFVSHFWGHDFKETVRALDFWADTHCQKMTLKESLVFWICLFALNQHKKAEEVGEKPQHGPFNAALAQATNGAVMVLDEDVKPFSRIWCLFEMSRLKELQRPFELICSEGSLSTPEINGKQAISRMLEVTCEALWRVSIVNAESSVDADKFQIWAEAADKSFRGMLVGGAQSFFERRIEAEGIDGLVSFFRDFDKYIKSLLSTTMLRIVLQNGDFAATARCLRFGAQLTTEHLAEIARSFESAGQEAWLRAETDGCTALMSAAQGGQEAVTRLLLEHRADVNAARSDGYTALMLAAQGGHTAVTSLLLESHADVRAADNTSFNALMQAALYGHEAVAELLLKHGADAKAPRNDGFTSLMLAAAGGHGPVASLLLEHGADATSKDDNGFTALMSAAYGGHEAVARLLLEHGADCRAGDRMNFTALMLAATNGHERVAELLVKHGADARGADANGFTPLMCAAGGGHQAVARLLLENGADVNPADKDGHTALMLAATYGHEALSSLLLENGADARTARLA